MKETPTISGHSHAHTTYASSGGAWVPAYGVNLQDCTLATTEGITFGATNVPGRAVQANLAKVEPIMTTRIVRVFILDPNENLPLENRILVKGNEELTDLNDQELFFELSMNELLIKHNDLRAKIKDKAKSSHYGRDVYLEPVRIRDLKMTVLTVAQF